MRSFEASCDIQATPEQVWTVLADAAGWPTWDSGVEGVEGRLGLGEKVAIRSAAAPGRAFSVTVTDLEAPRLLRLRGGMPLGLFTGERTYAVTAQGASSHFTMREEYTGPMLPLIWRSMPDLGPSFGQFAQGLKARVEHGG